MTESSLQAQSPFLVPVMLLGQVGSPLPTAQSLPNRPGSQVKAPPYFSFLITLSFFSFPFLEGFIIIQLESFRKLLVPHRETLVLF